MIGASLGDLIGHHAGRKPPDALALSYPDATLTWPELDKRVTQRARLLRSLGVTEGDFRKDLDTEQFAHDVHGVMLAYHHAARLLRDPRADDRATRAFEALVAAARLRKN